MQDPELFLLFCRKFSALNIEYLVTGSIASIIYGEPRLTHDIDLVILTHDINYANFSLQFPLDDFYCPPKDVFADQNQKSFNLIHHETGFKADVYIIQENSFNKWAFTNKNNINIGDEVISIAPIEYVIHNKVKFYAEGRSPKHISDIKGMLYHSEELINWQILNDELERLKINQVFKNMIKA